jgi:O-antigen/teichoic acid export membrane protein
MERQPDNESGPEPNEKPGRPPRRLYTRDKARRSLLDTATYRAISQVTTFLAYIVLVRGMSEHDFGVLNLLYAFIPVVGTFASFGLEQTLRRFQPEYLRAGNRAAAAWLVRFVASARFGTNVVLLALVLLAWNLVAPLFKLTPYRGEFALFCVLVMLHFQLRILQLTLASHMLHRFSVGSGAILSAVKFAAYFGLYSFHNLTLQNAIFVDTLAYGLAFLVLKTAHLRYCRVPGPIAPFRPDPIERRRLVRYGFYNNFNDAGTFVLNARSDNFFIAALLDPVAVGTYAFYTRLREMTFHLLPVNVFENVIQPLFFATRAEDARERIPRYFSLLLNANLLLQLPVLAYGTVYHAEIVTVLFGGKFLDSSWLLPVVLAFATGNVIATPVTLVAQYEEKAAIILLSKIFAIYNVVALLVLLPVAGLYGAAIATGTAQVMKNLFIWWHVRDAARWTNATWVLLTTLGVWGATVLVCQGVKGVIAAPPIVHMIFGILICGVAWLIYVRSPVLSTSDREILATVLRGREKRALRWLGVMPQSVV